MTFAARLAALRQVAPLHVLGTRGRYPRDFSIWSGCLTRAERYRLARSLPYSPRTTPVKGPRPGLRANLHALLGAPPGFLAAPEAPLATHGERRAAARERFAERDDAHAAVEHDVQGEGRRQPLGA